MIPKRIALKNFLSFGEGPGGAPGAVLDFTDNEPLWVLGGPNGIGKSAVFDAITYALYGQHRGGAVKAEQLIRHGANGFEVEFDFAFNEADYRIRRTRPRRGRTTQHLLRRVDGEWRCVRGTDSAGAVTADDVKGWVVDTLKLGYESFTNSVLLLQGDADKLFSASRDDRIAVLKGIIGFEEFEALSVRVHCAAVKTADRADDLGAQLAGVLPVTAAGQTSQAAQEALAEAVRRVEQAKQWERLTKQHGDLTRQLAEAEERHKPGRQLREAKLALDDLTAAVPVLEELFKGRARAAGTRAKHAAAGRDFRLKELARDVNANERLLLDVAAVEALEEKLGGYADDLDGLVQEADAAEGEAERASREAQDAYTRAETLREQAQKERDRFAAVGVGVTCTRCRQPVGEAHAAAERRQLAADLAARGAEAEHAKAAAGGAAQRYAAAQTHRKGVEQARSERNRLVAERDAKREHLPAPGEAPTAAEVRTRLVGLHARQAEAEGRPAPRETYRDPAPADAKRLEAERRRLGAAVEAAQRDVDGLQSELDREAGKEQTTLDQLRRLPGNWPGRLPNLDADRVAELAGQRDRLVAEGVDEKFKALEQDEARRAEWEKSRAAVDREIAAIPPTSRIPEAVGKAQHEAAKGAAAAAGKRLTDAAQARKDLTDRGEKYDRLTAARRAAAEQHRLHKKLDDLLGQAGLQRELVRDAEEQILAFANETLGHLDGDLALEEDTSPDSTRAFDLRVRRAGGEPIAVAFLSGSQRFRVAVSVALAVGRFAGGRARPLESVIIDEGFGSLDKDGLQAMAEELKRLQQASSLRRVILVSHQEEFTSQFPVGYRLSPGEGGTTAHPFRK